MLSLLGAETDVLQELKKGVELSDKSPRSSKNK